MGGRGFQEFPSLDGIRVLLVEDETDARELLEVVLQYADGEVISVDSAAAALEALKTDARPDVILIDIVMPGHDGYWLLDQVRALAGGRVLPAVAVTGRTRIHDRARAMQVGFQAYLTKPVDPLELCRLIRDLAGRGA